VLCSHSLAASPRRCFPRRSTPARSRFPSRRFFARWRPPFVPLLAGLSCFSVCPLSAFFRLVGRHQVLLFSWSPFIWQYSCLSLFSTLKFPFCVPGRSSFLVARVRPFALPVAPSHISFPLRLVLVESSRVVVRSGSPDIFSYASGAIIVKASAPPFFSFN